MRAPNIVTAPNVDPEENLERMRKGELYYAFVPDLIAERKRHFGMSEEGDDAQLTDLPIVEVPVKMDYGYNVKLGKGVYVNSNSTWIDTCEISVGERTLIGPNCSFYSGTHPLDPTIRNGTRGPESGKPITIGEDCWLGGNSTILPGVTIGKGSTVGAGSVVTKDVPPYHCVAGNPARIIRKIEVAGADDSGGEEVGADEAEASGAGAGDNEGEGVQVLAGEDAPTV
ncbi:hypothetical protein VPNG_07436 [Cytospora leucostoma]|uniref:Uncharacterized protein n=1 Tax=Cytospora leucostoma TaxID=1230097 RepID=A0A423WMG8_9PEZI|nr:hypothetical protein VPNG_07436 [Cytospora leucostoma]